MMGWNDNMSGGGWIVMMLAMIIFWGLVVVGIVAMFRTSRRDQDSPRPATERTSLQVLDERFAHGEIDVEEYLSRRDALRGETR